jgi:thiol-disulfide isomerase/thioredoxin
MDSKRLLSSLTLLSLVTLSAVSQSGKSPVLELGIRDTKGNVWKKDSLEKGKVYLLDFWATWCVTCKETAPIIAELRKDYHQKGFEVLAITMDEDLAAVRKYMAEKKPEFPILLDTKSAVTNRYKVKVVPTFVLVKDGVILKRWSGKIKRKDLETEISKALP